LEQRLSGLVLGVDDLGRAKAFLSALGWEAASQEDGIVAYNMLGASVLSLYPWSDVAAEIGVTAEEFGKHSAMIGQNVRSKEEVSEILAKAEAAGAKIVKHAQDVFWGGHSGYFQDPDGHYWEIAYNPFSPLGPKGGFQWNGGEGAL
jgi:uncharacterized protein